MTRDRARRSRRGVALALLGPLLMALAVLAHPTAAQEEPPTLPVAEATGFLGDWKLTVDFQGQNIEMAMSVLDEEGFVAAVVASPQGTQRITDIERTEDGLDLAFSSQVGAIHLELALDGADLVGKLATETGGFEASLRGVRGAIDPEELAAGGGLFGSPPKQATLELGGGRVSIRLPGENSSKAELQPRDDGTQLLILPDSASLKLRTDVDLAFGDQTIAGQLSESYPGVYSLWLLEEGDRWTLLVNREADIWGTQHEAEHDVTRVSLDHGTAESSGDDLVIELEPHEGGGLFRARWREHEWTAAFTPAP